MGSGLERGLNSGLDRDSRHKRRAEPCCCSKVGQERTKKSGRKQEDGPAWEKAELKEAGTGEQGKEWRRSVDVCKVICSEG